jgi:hypothetical protein
VAGWAIDAAATANAGIDAIHAYAFPSDGGGPVFLGVAAGGGSRPDVAAAFGSQFAASGYALAASLPPGSYTLVVFARSTISGAFTSVSRAIVVRAAGRPIVTIDTPAGGSPDQPFLLAGWAIDRDASAGSGIDTVHAWAFPDTGSPVFLGAATADGVRDDVAGQFGARFRTSGFNLVIGGLAPGTYRIVVYGHSTVTDAFTASAPVLLSIH